MTTHNPSRYLNAAAGARDRQLCEKGREQFRGLLKLNPWYLRRLLKQDRVDRDQEGDPRKELRS